jgi:hypothetical protein
MFALVPVTVVVDMIASSDLMNAIIPLYFILTNFLTFWMTFILVMVVSVQAHSQLGL